MPDVWRGSAANGREGRGKAMSNEILDMLHEAISILQCAEDSAEGYIKTALGVANGMLLGAVAELGASVEGEG